MKLKYVARICFSLQSQKEKMDCQDYLNIVFVKMCSILGLVDNENIYRADCSERVGI